jgi:hypothetical protein
MPKLKEVEISSEQVISLVHQLDTEDKWRVLKEISHDEKYWKKYYAYAEKIAKEKGFTSLTEEGLEELLHER